RGRQVSVQGHRGRAQAWQGPGRQDGAEGDRGQRGRGIRRRGACGRQERQRSKEGQATQQRRTQLAVPAPGSSGIRPTANGLGAGAAYRETGTMDIRSIINKAAGQNAGEADKGAPPAGKVVPAATRKAAATPSLISADLRIVGDLSSAGDIHVDGTIEGDVR